ncbi:MAG: membrane protein [Blastomonas sp. CACIA14H2]|jgi:chloramphenicol-sensitive protein RarD|uniref:EamA family transporter RarD n=1 Tax=unclassified Blastomonas TaxID=2626550 RepID=UPI0003D042C4|nr:EamA family transporter RarD [Blastomonas sp. UPD001]ESZ88612.1 MAG: membrane protein [Blastomonas sp. CACIA14H2]
MSGEAKQLNGLPEAVGAYTIWGFMPLFFKQLQGISPVEIVAHRVMWSVLLVLAILWARKSLHEFLIAIRDPRTRRFMIASTTLIAGNWLIYIWAITNEHILAGSLGYYINPLINVALGVVFFSERMNRTQLIAITLAAAGVLVLASESLASIWISLSLAGTFGLYGMVRKMAPVGSLPGLACETVLMLPFAIGYAIWAHLYDPTPGFGYSGYTDAFLIAGGAITTIPLLLFASAARKMPLSTLGFVQFIGPTIQFMLGVFVYDEPFTRAHAICFALIWSAVAVFCLDGVRRSRAARVAQQAA